MSSNVDHFLNRCVCLDLEANEAGEIFKIGAVYKNRELCLNSSAATIAKDLRTLDDFAAQADFLLGHNLLDHDLTLLNQTSPGLRLLQKPVVDTLFLSPLAFPENPYHRLVKDYKLVRDSLNDPVADCRLALSLFRDQWESFQRILVSRPGLLSLFHYCFQAPTKFKGCAALFAAIGAEQPSLPEALTILTENVGSAGCRNVPVTFLENRLGDETNRPTLAYCLAWLQVAGGNSVLPPWVRRRFPGVVEILKSFRETPCYDPGCEYCRDNHNPELQLEKLFGFKDFRRTPATSEGKSLQEAIVRHAMIDRPLLGILPTGGGKSLCYQLPALARYQRRGVLTIVISPLQALMKDQVDNLRNRTGFPAAAALYGLLTAPERGQVLEDIRLGNTGILYIAPEQLRSLSFRRIIGQREIGCWVFDEAHCLSKWGHDFRPDYLYAGRFIKEFAAEFNQEAPPIQCFTATAKQDVKEEIMSFFKAELGQDLRLFEAEVQRDNLHFTVLEVQALEKIEHVDRLLTDHLGEGGRGSAIVYCSRRATTVEVAETLANLGWNADFFHAGLEPPEKQHVLNNFLGGHTEIICATNAFGMGVDKEDVRLVIHYDIPGSLENYLQEAGRAGRDRGDAECILLYDENDIENQFQLSSGSRLHQDDIRRILRTLRRLGKKRDQEIVLTSGELLSREDLDLSFDEYDHQAATKVITALSWLERAGFLVRNENRTSVFQGSPLVQNLEEARRRIKDLDLSRRQRVRWLLILKKLMNHAPGRGFSADELAENLPPETSRNRPDETPAQAVLRTLHAMAEQGLIKKNLLLSAYVRHKVNHSSRQLSGRIIALEKAMLDVMQEEAPDAGQDAVQRLSLRRLNQRLLDLGFADSTPEHLRNLLGSLARDGRGLAGRQGSLEYRAVGMDNYNIHLKRDWPALRETAEIRQQAATVILRAIIAKIPADTPASANILVEFSDDDLLKALKADLLLFGRLRDPLAAMDRALMFLHEQKVITLQNGLAVFRQAMTITLTPEKRRYGKADYEPLEFHYGERIFQIHVMNEYARQGIAKITRALKLVRAYFQLDRRNFIQRFFPGLDEMLGRATSRQSYREIVDSLHNPAQAALVCAPEKENILVLAGPGSGKTRVIVHRCAYLLRVHRVPARTILVLCFNRSSVFTLKKRLRDLVGDEANGVAIHTYHGLALRLTGHSLATRMEGDMDGPVLEDILREATSLLDGSRELAGIEPDEVRDRFLGGLRHILVDEYQDIDTDQYHLISALTGRTLANAEEKPTLMAVGDDDQNIYRFRGTSVEFIRRFRDDYRAEPRFLLENYRSSAHIISASNRLISGNPKRLKQEQSIRVNRARELEPAGGEWGAIDPVAEGRVRLITTPDGPGQAAVLLSHIQAMKNLDPAAAWHDFAILAREWRLLQPVGSLAEHLEIPLGTQVDTAAMPGLHRVREFRLFLEALGNYPETLIKSPELLSLLTQLKAGRHSLWWEMLTNLLDQWSEESRDAATDRWAVLEFLYESLQEERKNLIPRNRVFIGTAHAAKGLEFDHVLIPDGGWDRAASPEDLEEQRRLYYTAMTRARKTLTLMERRDCGHPFLKNLQGEFLLKSEADPLAELTRFARERSRYQLGMEDFFLSFGGAKPAGHPLHQALASLNTGDRLSLALQHDRLRLLAGNIPVACLSRKASQVWRERLDQIIEVRITAIVSRKKTDGDPEYRERYRVEQWEVPLVELTCISGKDIAG